MTYSIYLGLIFPLLGFLILLLLGGKIGRKYTGFIACTTIFLSFICFASHLFVISEFEKLTLFSWIHIGKINADFSLVLDPLSLLMTLIITGVGFVIHVYSTGYMEHEKDFRRYFAFLNFFIFAMLLLVLAGNLLLLFIGWEGVGLASYLLIGFWYQRPAAATAATKAFVINRIGDLALLLGILMTFQLFATSDIDEINRRVVAEFAIGADSITILSLLYFIGAMGKSAQLPLHTWLPDAMEGPTPVSALIHAATMVTAGVYLVVRLHPIFMSTPLAMQIVGIIGAFTALFASLCALGQLDLKKVLAYSTISQLGLMFLACGAGAFYSAMFHLTTHAFVKALLFLSAGNVIHMLQDTTDMQKMGGLSNIFTKTNWLFLIGVLALSGIPPLATFFSKDLILEQEYLAGFEVLFYTGLAASVLTGFYLTRAYCLTFMGKQKTEKNILSTTKEAPLVMLFPVAFLAFLSVVGGFLGFAFGKTPLLEKFLNEVGVTLAEKQLSSNFTLSPEVAMAIGGSLLGVTLSAFIYTKFSEQIGTTLKLFKNAFYLDDIYDLLIVKPFLQISKFIADFMEPRVFDASIRYTTKVIEKIAEIFQLAQNGQIRSYAAWLIVGMIVLIVYIVV